MYLGDPAGAAEAARWEQYQNELMTGFPEAPIEEVIVTPEEGNGTGINRRAFYVCNDVGDKWILLPDVNPQQVNVSRNIRWFLTGNLDMKVSLGFAWLLVSAICAPCSWKLYIYPSNTHYF
jgi:hypothetical protein